MAAFSTHPSTSSRLFLHSRSLTEIKLYKRFPYYYSLAQPQCSGTVPVLLTFFCFLFPCPEQIWYSFPWPFYPWSSEENGLEMTHNFLLFFPQPTALLHVWTSQPWEYKGLRTKQCSFTKVLRVVVLDIVVHKQRRKTRFSAYSQALYTKRASLKTKGN